MVPEDSFDIKKAIEKSASRQTLQDLAMKGIQRVRVIDEKTMTRLIEEALQRIISTRAGVMTDQERKKIVEESRSELNRLIKEHQQAKQSADLVEQDKNQLVREVENLQRQIQLQRKVGEEDAKRRYDEGIASQQTLIKEFRDRSASLEAELTQLRSTSQKAETNEKLVADLTRMNEALQAKLSGKLDEFGETLSSQNKSDDRNALWSKLQELAANDDQVAAKLETLFSRMTDSLSKKIQGIRLRTMAGDAVAPYKPGELTLQSLFEEELESNLRAIGIDEQQAGKLGGGADKLRKMRMGSADNNEKNSKKKS